MERVFKLSNELFNYLLNILADEKIKKQILNHHCIDDGDVVVTLDVDSKIDLMDYIEDKQLQIGFVNQDYLNDDGKKLQQIYDEIYWQTNN